MKQNARLVFLVCFFSAHSLAFCNVDGAFGIKFGDKIGKGAIRLEGGKASTYYSVRIPDANPVFDEYQVRVDTKTKKIFEIIGLKIITPMPTSTMAGLKPEQISQGKTKARRGAETFLALLSKEQLKEVIQNEYGSPQWHLRISEQVMLEINGYGPWDANVRCTSLLGERELGKRVWPELYE
jgi:hypothetical protein